ncbi:MULTISPECIES: methyltransferase [Streptomyces]|uniref:Methyltransferase n=1 Tax=Streptomyces lonegramiae TaxID=3075524 RepID=A0ABU2XBU2_9ACTN|nr:methyltransferase [Streptomyces sp. DSM 41529]MDT0542575.1 methyltransferase [Streptomyces sp. DSM 41529]
MTEHAESSDDQQLKPVDVIAHSALPVAGLMQLILGHWGTQVISTLATLGIPDSLADGPRGAEDLAKQHDVDPRALYRVLRAAATLRVLDHAEDETFSLTEAGHFLRTDYPFSMRYNAMLHGSRWHWDPWSLTPEAVRKGGEAFSDHHGLPYYAYIDKHPEAGDLFDSAMTAMAAQAQLLAVSLYEFGKHKVVVDVGGGEGVVLSNLLETHAELRGVLFDRERVVGNAKRLLTESGYAERVDFVPGDMFDSVPEGGDCYLLSMVVNDYNDDKARKLLENCRAAMDDDATLVLFDMVIPANGNPSFATLGDIECLVVSGGELRTEPELRTLLGSAGFRLEAVHRGFSPVCAVVAKPE